MPASVVGEGGPDCDLEASEFHLLSSFVSKDKVTWNKLQKTFQVKNLFSSFSAGEMFNLVKVLKNKNLGANTYSQLGNLAIS